MFCKICGDENNVVYRIRSNMCLCASCHEDTPKKVGFKEFCLSYFHKDADTLYYVDRRIAKEFFDDYRTSKYGSVADYITATTK